jgi:hypothetical protein
VPYDPSGLFNVLWPGYRFQMTDFQSVGCWATSAGRAIKGYGTGKLNYKAGYTISFIITDNRAAGGRDSIEFLISGPGVEFYAEGSVYIGGHNTHHCEMPEN